MVSTPKKRRQTANIHIRIVPERKAALQRAAEDAGLSLSEFMVAASEDATRPGWGHRESAATRRIPEQSGA